MHVTSNKTINIFGLDEPHSLSRKMEGYVLESSAPDTMASGTRSQLQLHQPRFTSEEDGKVEQAPQAIIATVSRLSPSYLVGTNNSVITFTKPRLPNLPLDTQEAVGRMFDSVCNAYEVTTIPLPNRMVQPQETWPARVAMLITAGPARQVVRMIGRRRVVSTIPAKKEVRALNLTCTYEGTRTVNGIHQGYVLLAGVVNGTGPTAKDVYGKVNGHAMINLDSGMLSQVKTTISLEVETENPGVRILVSNDNVIERVEGNTQNIQKPIPIVRPNPTPIPPVDSKPVAPGWKAYNARNGAFAVWLPDTATSRKEGSSKIAVKKNAPLVLVITEVTATFKGGPNFTASGIDANPFTAIGKGTTVERIDWLRDLFQEGSKGKLSGEKLLKLGRLEGKEFLIEGPKGVTRYRVYMFVNKYFLASVGGTKEQVESKDATTFLDSYRPAAAYTGIFPKKDK